MAKLNDQTTPRTPAELPAVQRPRYKVTDWAGMVRAAEGRQPRYEPDYEFSGRTFKRRVT